eukprot:scaffold402839_cov38-Prasinocladus_malaysianus.AAC.1
MWLLCKDPEAGFPCLECTDTGFGLVVSASQLRKAIQAKLSGGLYAGEVQTYSGTFLRMRETLAVSYRWQDTSQEVTSDMFINMSVWQLRALCDAISNSNAHYVWIDRISVPQLLHMRLKKELLSRMMAVYATSGWTVALRSCEPEGHR